MKKPTLGCSWESFKIERQGYPHLSAILPEERDWITGFRVIKSSPFGELSGAPVRVSTPKAFYQGGGWNFTADAIGPVYTSLNGPTGRYGSTGFRVLREGGK
jgi:hypothetical protein